MRLRPTLLVALLVVASTLPSPVRADWVEDDAVTAWDRAAPAPFEDNPDINGVDITPEVFNPMADPPLKNNYSAARVSAITTGPYLGEATGWASAKKKYTKVGNPDSLIVTAQLTAVPYVDIPARGQAGHNSGTAYVALQPSGGGWISVPDPDVAGLVQLQTTDQEPGAIDGDDPDQDVALAELTMTTELVILIDVHILLNVPSIGSASSIAMGICNWSAQQ